MKAKRFEFADLAGWSPLQVMSLVGLGLFFVLALGGELLAPFSGELQNSQRILHGPSFTHWMGTDRLGRDLWSRVILGSRMSLAIGVLTALISLVIGSVVGGLAGWFGGLWDRLFVALVDLIYSLPTLVLMILVALVFDVCAFVENPQWRAFFGTLIALSLVGWMTMARLVRGQIVKVKSQSFVDAGRISGMRLWDLLSKIVFPNIWGPLLVLVTLRIPANILFESFLSFVGLGLRPPYSSWGSLAADGVDSLEFHPHLILFPAGILFLAMMAFQILGDRLRESMDPEIVKSLENQDEKI